MRERPQEACKGECGDELGSESVLMTSWTGSLPLICLDAICAAIDAFFLAELFGTRRRVLR